MEEIEENLNAGDSCSVSSHRPDKMMASYLLNGDLAQKKVLCVSGKTASFRVGFSASL